MKKSKKKTVAKKRGRPPISEALRRDKHYAVWCNEAELKTLKTLRRAEAREILLDAANG